MANYSHIARPYATAAFEYARDHQVLPEWKHFLDQCQLCMTNHEMQLLLLNPHFSSQQLKALLITILEPTLTNEMRYFLNILETHHRFVLLPEMSERFNELLAAHEKVIHVKITTAVPVSNAFKDKLSAALNRRTQQNIELSCNVDDDLIGGAILHLGDKLVIDDSIRGKLTRLLEFSLR